MRELYQNQAASAMVFFASAGEHIAGVAGINSVTASASKDGAAFALITATASAERGRGWYNFTLNSGWTDTLGELAFTVSAASADPVDFKYWVTYPKFAASAALASAVSAVHATATLISDPTFIGGQGMTASYNYVSAIGAEGGGLLQITERLNAIGKSVFSHRVISVPWWDGSKSVSVSYTGELTGDAYWRLAVSEILYSDYGEEYTVYEDQAPTVILGSYGATGWAQASGWTDAVQGNCLRLDPFPKGTLGVGDGTMASGVLSISVSDHHSNIFGYNFVLPAISASESYTAFVPTQDGNFLAPFGSTNSILSLWTQKVPVVTGDLATVTATQVTDKTGYSILSTNLTGVTATLISDPTFIGAQGLTAVYAKASGAWTEASGAYKELTTGTYKLSTLATSAAVQTVSATATNILDHLAGTYTVDPTTSGASAYRMDGATLLKAWTLSAATYASAVPAFIKRTV